LSEAAAGDESEAKVYVVGDATGCPDGFSSPPERRLLSPVAAGCAPVIGRDSPRNLPRLATPTPQVNVVLYPAQSRPRFKHCEQYGRRRSQAEPSRAHVKQSSAAPLTTVLFRRFLGGAVEVDGDLRIGG
jgi:hypothetical protein